MGANKVALAGLVVLVCLGLCTSTPIGFKYEGREFTLAGDILLPVENGELRSGLRNESFRWPMGIVYVDLDTTFTTKERATIYAGLDEIESHTCIQFQPRTTQETGFVFIEKGAPGSGCISELGYQNGTSQVLNLEPPKCINSGIIAHEMIHGLGFWHEHMRTDRDEYVTINYDNIDEVNYKGFEKQTAEEVDDYGIAYDYSSIMHYFWNEWAVDPTQPSIIPKDPEAILGGSILTARDILKINAMYAKFCAQRDSQV